MSEADFQADEGQVVLPEHQENPYAQWGAASVDMSPVQQAVSSVKAELKKVIVGQENMLDLLLVGMLANGHVLIEGVPGIAKTLSARLMAQTMDLPFSRIQFTPDMMPSDVVGTTVFNMQTSKFTFNQGPIFASIVLIDEINRAPAKTQSALFEVMEEQQVTVDGQTYEMGGPFFVMATQNPIEQEGTYRLPEAQLDRFLFRIIVQHPALEDEKAILHRFKSDFITKKVATQVTKTLDGKRILALRSLIEQVYIKDGLIDYIAQVVVDTRNNGDLYLGASPRASLAIVKAAKVVAAMSGRDFVIPEDIHYVAYPILNHRIILTPEREIEGLTTQEVIQSTLQKIEIPR